MTAAVDLLDLDGQARTAFIYQSEASECALACLAMIAGTHGLETDLATLRQRYPLSLKGATLKQVINIAQTMGFNARPMRGELRDLQHVALPTILHWDMNHFVVLTKIRRGRYRIHDPARGVLLLSQEEVSKHWTGVVLECLKSESFKPKVDARKLKISQLWSSMSGFWSSLGQIFALSSVLQIVALASPYYMQIGIDTVLPSVDTSLLNIIALGFGGVTLISFATSWLRSVVLVTLNNALSYQITVNLFRHLVRLPLPWFEKRHVGDIVSRFGSTQPISQLLSQGLIASVMDGLMALATVGLMATYSLKLCLLSICALALYLALRLAFLHTLKLRNVDAITKAANENTLFMETVRGIAAIKAFGQEGNRQRQWQTSKAEAVNANIKLGRLSAGFDAGNQLVVGLENVLFVWIAISLAIKAELTVGMIFAFQAYRRQFIDAGVRLIEFGISYNLLAVHMTRIADIAFTAPEALDHRPAPSFSGASKYCPSIELRNVHFSYGMGEPDILKGINLFIPSGKSVVLVGPSGGGKTTLLKIMMGLVQPTYGEVLIDGIPMESFGLARWRALTGSVAQDDALYAGSLADNISFFDPEADMERIRRAAGQARIAGDIEKMPMRYETLVGDMGSALSGGQKQRVLLARALYRDPAILFCDEATAHLDPETEAAVMGALNNLGIARCLVAHRPGAISQNDRVLLLMNGNAKLISTDDDKQ